ncbi:FMRFamide receptor-like [Lineus longissimus]|uniref:FMRFamide receptor-like n=1 Tax=Lineus longissimus TaxID=88925 RepID=UPI00315CB3C4
MAATNDNTTFTMFTERGRCLHQVYPVVDYYVWIKVIFQVPLIFIIAVIGLPANILAVIGIGYERPYTSTSVLLQGLAVTDSLVLISQVFGTSLQFLYYYTGLWFEYILFIAHAYRYIYTAQYFSKTASIFITLCVATERYIAVCRPLRAATVCTKRNAYISLFTIYLGAFFYRIPLFFTQEVKYRYDPCSRMILPRWYPSDIYFNFYFDIIYLTSVYISINSVIPIISLTILTYLILSSLKQATTSHLSKNDTKRAKHMDMVTLRVVIVVVVFIILELPGGLCQIPAVLRSFSALTIDFRAYESALAIGYFLINLNSFVNFFIYCATGRRFRRALGEVFRCRRK